MTMMIHRLYHKTASELALMGELTLPTEHWLSPPSWLQGYPTETPDWGTIRVTVSKQDVLRLVGNGRYSLIQRERSPAFEQAHESTVKLLESLEDGQTYVVEWLECY